MGPTSRKELELRLKVVADTAAGTRALQELARSAARTVPWPTYGTAASRALV